ncbi:Hypothetical protein SMAX5B_015333 [Scophthalmus maximus]|uniref:Uncharacterized protein n=1 Tax=Scophthalmus maximus TaxID=52904 RepID=A0A2U9C8T8_SCOMX|nr:Hypothetical protein SMAX5B_015333 [Scophthalmus maximus]
MSEDKQPTLSVIAQLLQEALSPSLEDSTGVRDLKAAVKNNLRTRPYHPCLLKSEMTPSPDCRLRLPLLHVM